MFIGLDIFSTGHRAGKGAGRKNSWATLLSYSSLQFGRILISVVKANKQTNPNVEMCRKNLKYCVVRVTERKSWASKNEERKRKN